MALKLVHGKNDIIEINIKEIETKIIIYRSSKDKSGPDARFKLVVHTRNMEDIPNIRYKKA